MSTQGEKKLEPGVDLRMEPGEAVELNLDLEAGHLLVCGKIQRDAAPGRGAVSLQIVEMNKLGETKRTKAEYARDLRRIATAILAAYPDVDN